MKVYIYAGLLRLVEKSGVGQAFYHQKQMLESAGIEASFHDSREAEIVHINTVFPDSPLTAILSRLRGKRVVCYGHSTMEDFKRSFKGSDALAPLFKRWIIFCYTRGDVHNKRRPSIQKSLLTGYGIKKPIFALSNGVDTGKFKYDPTAESVSGAATDSETGEKGCRFRRAFLERKGLLDFVELARHNPDRRFFVSAHTDLRLVPGKIRRAIETSRKNLTFPGFVSSEELIDAYCGCDLFLFMSYEETEGIAILEALSCEIPTLVRDIPVYRGWLRDGVNVYTAGSVEAFQSKADGILNGTLPRLCEAGREAAKDRSIERTGEKLVEIYKTLRAEDC